MTNCKACGKEIAKGAKKCVHCGKDQRSFFMKHKILTVIFGLVILIVIGSVIDGKKGISGSSNTVVTKPQVIISSVDLAKAYTDNEVKADNSYKGKLADISGQIEDIGESMGSTYITLSDGQEVSITAIQCFFDDKAQIEKVSNLKKGDNVTVEGIIDGKSLNVAVDKCKIK
jgi:hypothetical protein